MPVRVSRCSTELAQGRNLFETEWRGCKVMDVWDEFLLFVYGLPPAMVFAGAWIARLVAQRFGKDLGWLPALGIGVVVFVASFVAYATHLALTG